MSVCFRAYKSTSPTVKGDLFWDTGAENMGLVSGKLTLRNIELSTMTFTLPSCHPNIPSRGSDELGAYLNVYRVRNSTEELIHRAYVSKIDFDLSGNASYTCADVFGIINNVRPYTSTTQYWHVNEYLQDIIYSHNSTTYPEFTLRGIKRWDSYGTGYLYPSYADGSTFPKPWKDDAFKLFRTLAGQETPIKFLDKGVTPVAYRTNFRVITHLVNKKMSSLTSNPQEHLYVMAQVFDPANYSTCANSQLLERNKNIVSAEMSYEMPEYNSLYASDTDGLASPTFWFTGDNGKNNVVCPAGSTYTSLNKLKLAQYDVSELEITTAEELEAAARNDIEATAYKDSFNLTIEALDLGYIDDSVEFFDILFPIGIKYEDKINNNAESIVYTHMDEYNIDFVNPVNSKISANISPRITR